MKITTEKIVRYYVEQEGWIFGGPFDTKAEAAQCLRNYRANQNALKTKQPKVTIRIRCNQWGNWYGYIGGKKVKEFYRTPEQSQQEAAQAWHAEQCKIAEEN